MSATVQLEKRGHIALVTIDRPAARNAVDGPTAAALADAFRPFDTDPSLYVAVLPGTHSTFCAALREETKRGIEVVASGETLAGAQRFSRGAGTTRRS